jgi:hypothetical protein
VVDPTVVEDRALMDVGLMFEVGALLDVRVVLVDEAF